jgi:transcriptional regulator with XRE-family HTH domain
MVDMTTTRMTTTELAANLGAQLRALRIDRDLDQEALARRASVSRSAVRALETGHGSSTSTLIKVVRALDASDWLMALHTTDDEISPMGLLREQRQKPTARQRTRKAD